jgi:hypothetical protein
MKTERLRVAGAIAAKHALVVAPPQAGTGAANDALAAPARMPGVLRQTVAAERAIDGGCGFPGLNFHPYSLG